MNHLQACRLNTLVEAVSVHFSRRRQELAIEQ